MVECRDEAGVIVEFGALEEAGDGRRVQDFAEPGAVRRVRLLGHGGGGPTIRRR